MRNDEPVILLLLLFCTLAIKSSLHFTHTSIELGYSVKNCQPCVKYRETQCQKSCDTSLISLNLSCFCAASYMYGAINSSFPSNLISGSLNKTNSAAQIQTPGRLCLHQCIFQTRDHPFPIAERHFHRWFTWRRQRSPRTDGL